MYDITDQNSFKNIKNSIINIEKNVQTNICKVLVGNNCDKSDRLVTEEEGQKLADQFNIRFFEASPRTNQNVNEVFYYLVGEILKINENKGLVNNKIIKNKKIKDKKITENISANNNKDKEDKKKSYEKNIDLNKNVSFKLYKFLNY